MQFSNSRIPELDGIRGAAILLVVIWHYVTVPLSQSSSPVLHLFSRATIQSWSGVDLFFVLSGFLIGGILIDATGSENYFRTFYLRRAFRILPLYALACCAYFPLSLWVARAFRGARVSAMPWYIYAGFAQNFWLNNARWHVFLAHTWSLAVEEQFYLTLPALIWLVPAKHLWKILVGGLAAVEIFRSIAYLHFYPEWRTAAYVLLPCRADDLLMGALAAVAVRDRVVFDFILERRRWLYAIGASLAAALVFCTWRGWGAMSTAMSTIGYTVLGGFYLALLLLTITSNGGLKRLFSRDLLRWLGTIAYGLYLIHVPALDFSFHFFEHREPVLARPFDLVPIAIALLLSLALAQLSWRFFESRLVRYGHHFNYRFLVPEADIGDRVRSGSC